MRTYLVQRAKKETRSGKKGIDSIIHLDYMGASEFEWGALPKSLKQIRADLSNYIYFDVTIKSKTVTVFCQKSLKNEVEEYLLSLISREMRTHEYTAIPDYFNDGYHKDTIDFWWDVENDLMFWVKEDTFTRLFKETILIRS